MRQWVPVTGPEHPLIVALLLFMARLNFTHGFDPHLMVEEG